MPQSARLEAASLVDLLSTPKSVAIVGASATPGSYSHRAFTYLRDYGYAGSLTLVNPNRSDVEGHPCLPSVEAIEPGSVDVALVAVRAEAAPAAVADVARIGARAAVTIAGGVDDAGKQALRETAATSGMRIIGPNCIGSVASRGSAYVSFSSVVGEGRPREGRIALVTQSGAMGNALLLSLLRRGAGISHWITTGDEVDVGALELIAGMLEQPDVGAVGVFFEGMGDLEWMPAVREAIARTGKSVYVVKGAQTAAGRSAAAGHTGRVVGSGEASVTVMRDAGIQVLQSMPQLADALVAADLSGRLPGRRVGIVSVSGGAGVLAADAVVRTDRLTLAALTDDPVLETKLGGRVHELGNPLDVAGSPTEVFADWATTVAGRPSTDVVLAVQANIMHDEQLLGEALASAEGRSAPLVVVPFSEEDPLSRDVVLRLAAARIPVMASAERAIAALATLPIDGDDAGEAPAGGDHGHDADRDVVGLEEAVELIGGDLPWARHRIADTREDGRAAAEELGFPVVLKAAGRTLHHRSDSGAVAVGVTAGTFDASWDAVEAAAGAAGDAVMVQEQAAGGAEVMVSAMRDPELGALAIVRPGGVLTELIHGSAILWGGWDAATRRATLERSVVGTVLLGYRGGPVYDVGALAGVVETLLEAVASERIAFVELNPVLVGTAGVALVDALATPGAQRPAPVS
jgi:acyl-CoA synthetase (NDP forming)